MLGWFKTLEQCNMPLAIDSEPSIDQLTLPEYSYAEPAHKVL